jgi:hypothetical protein
MGAVVSTGLAKFVIADWLNRHVLFMIGASLFWLAFVILRTKRSPGVLEEWGFTTRNLMRSAQWLLPPATFFAVAMVLVGLAMGRALLSWRIFPVLLLYPLWGFVQQFLIVALLAGNLRKTSLPEPAVVVITALLFAAVHIPSLPLVVITFAMALVTTLVFLRLRTLYAIGVFHGLLATIAYFFVLGRDPATELLRLGLWP